MTADNGSNSESSEPVFDLESQLDDLLEQIDKAEPGLIATPAPKTIAETDTAQDLDAQTIAADSTQDDDAVEAANFDDADHDLEADFEAVEPIQASEADAPLSSATSTVDQFEPVNEVITNDTDDEESDDEDLVDSDEDDPDAVAFSPDDFITAEQAEDEQEDQPVHHQQHAAHIASKNADKTPATASQQDAQNSRDDQDDQSNQDEDDPLGLDLASQIQQLLDDARTDDSSPVDQAPPRVIAKSPAKPLVEAIQEPAPVESQDEAVEVGEAGELSDEASDEETLADSEDLQSMLDAIAQATATPEDTNPLKPLQDDASSEAVSQMSSDPELLDEDANEAAMSLQDIDQMLADEADEAVAGDFETVNEVMTHPPVETAATSGQATDAQHADAVSQTQATDDLASDATGKQADDDDEMDFAGSFETTQEIITQGPEDTDAGGFSSTASAVARELDEQPELQRNKTQASQNNNSQSSQSGTAGKISRLPSLAAFSKVPDVARSLCTTISRPMEAVAPQTRDMVGYVGLITLFWGSVTVIVKLIYALT